MIPRRTPPFVITLRPSANTLFAALALCGLLASTLGPGGFAWAQLPMSVLAAAVCIRLYGARRLRPVRVDTT